MRFLGCFLQAVKKNVLKTFVFLGNYSSSTRVYGELESILVLNFKFDLLARVWKRV